MASTIARLKADGGAVLCIPGETIQQLGRIDRALLPWAEIARPQVGAAAKLVADVFVVGVEQVRFSNDLEGLLTPPKIRPSWPRNEAKSVSLWTDYASRLIRGALTFSSGFKHLGHDAKQQLRIALESIIPDFASRDLTASELVSVARAFRAALFRLLQRLLGLLHYEYADHPPPHAESPCGILRLATPETPRGPELCLHVEAHSALWALAA